jgi:hypothetical protein
VGAVCTSSAASANASELAIEQLIFVLNLLSQGAFLGLDLVGARDIVPGCQIVQLIVRLDLDLVCTVDIVLGWLPMTDRSLQIAIAGVDFGAILGFRRKHNGGCPQEDDHSNQNRVHGHAPPN